MGTCTEEMDDGCGIGEVLALKVCDAPYIYGHRKMDSTCV